MTDHTQDEGAAPVIRPAQPEDDAGILALFNEGVEAGSAAPDASQADLEHLEETYLSGDGDSGFWVAEDQAQIVGMVGVQVIEPDSAEIRRLRVGENHRRRGIGAALLKTAVNHCRERGLLKVSLDVLIDRKPAIELFEKTGFRLNRERVIDNRTLLDFYIDLYKEH